MSGLTTLPTKTDGSLGREKSDLPGSDPSPDLDYYVPAAEHEAIKDAIVALGEEVGLHDGSTAGSLVERVATLEASPGFSGTLADLNTAITDADVPALAGDIGGTAASPTITQARGLRETAGPTTLAMGAVADGEALVRSGSSLVGATPPGFSHVSVTGNTTLPARNAVISVDTTAVSAPGTLSLTLPAAAAGRIYLVKKVDGDQGECIGIVRAASELIDGASATRILPGSEQSVDFSAAPDLAPVRAWWVWCDGTNWWTQALEGAARHTAKSGAPSNTVDTWAQYNPAVPDGGSFVPGSFWYDTSPGTPGHLYLSMGQTLGQNRWQRVDAVAVLAITGSTTLPVSDAQCFVDTTSGAVPLTLPTPGGANAGRQYVITRTNASGTDGISLIRTGTEKINGVAATFDLPGSDTEDYGRWHVVSDGTDWWVTGGTGLV